MNQLSWLLFWADVAPSLSRALCFFCFIAFFGFGFLVVIGYDAKYDNNNQPTDNLSRMCIRFRKLLWLLPLFFVGWIISFAVPMDKNTYYAIAASEIGERMIHTPTAGKAFKALDAWLDRQITPEPQEPATGNTSK